jgi:uncharacterized protein (UPF0333 family)
MEKFYKENKIFIAIILAALIIGGFIYLSSRKSTGATTAMSAKATEAKKTSGGVIPTTLDCIDFKDAESHIGEIWCVSGVVDNISISTKGNIFLNFCPDYKTCSFRAVIFNSNSSKFSNPEQYQGKTVEISGLIKGGTISSYQGKPEIIISDSSQLKVK